MQLVVGLLSVSLSMLRDCRLHLPHYRISATVINNLNVILVYVITVLNVIITGFGILPSDMTTLTF